MALRNESGSASCRVLIALLFVGTIAFESPSSLQGDRAAAELQPDQIELLILEMLGAGKAEGCLLGY